MEAEGFKEFIEKINNSNKDNEAFKNFSKLENQIKDYILEIILRDDNYKSIDEIGIEITWKLGHEVIPDNIIPIVSDVMFVAHELTKINILNKKTEIKKRTFNYNVDDTYTIDYVKLNKDYINKIIKENKDERRL
mgnify:CR=1 FL=1